MTDRILRESRISPGELDIVVHGTTVATNAIIEGNIARTAFVTTEGFRDMLEIARQIRPTLYDLQFEKLQPLVPRYLCFGVPERLGGGGEVLNPLDEDAVRGIAEQIGAEGVESIAVCLLHAYLNPVHEQRVGTILADCLPGVAISLSSDVAPEFREYYRASTTVINAGIRPVVDRYLARIDERLSERGVGAEKLVMQSSGGVLSFEAARERPVFMVESGPAAGVIAATELGRTLGRDDLISLDIGGTTAKVGLVQGGEPRVTREYEVGETAQGSMGASRGAGYPIRAPVIDLVEIGTGGGSIAWVDSGGALRVGPRSAGADPGPACYGQGGTEPTVTDANLVLGRLNPGYFLGGEIALDVERAKDAIQRHCAEPLGMEVVEAAHGIVEIANASMTNALRLVSIQRGYDPRDFALVAFGGAGPVHANRLAAQMDIPSVVIPTSPGVFSAVGLLATDLKHDYSTTMVQPVDRIDLDALEAGYRSMQAAGRAVLEREGIPEESMEFRRQVDMRYTGQSYELTVALPGEAGRLQAQDLETVLDAFHREHDRAYGYSAPAEPVEFVTLRLSAIGQIQKPRPRLLDATGGDLPGALKATRPVYFGELGGFTECPIYDRYALWSGCSIEGPAIIAEIDSTTLLHPGSRAEVDPYGNLALTVG